MSGLSKKIWLFLMMTPSIQAAELVCVRWTAVKTVGFVSDVTVVGKNCQAKIKVESLDPEKSRARITIPADQFDSGNAKRDGEVAQLLGQGMPQGEIVFETDEIKVGSAWSGLKPGFEIPGVIEISSGKHRIIFKISSVTSEFISAEWTGKLSELNLERPRVLGGVIANVHDSITLGIQIPCSKL